MVSIFPYYTKIGGVCQDGFQIFRKNEPVQRAPCRFRGKFESPGTAGTVFLPPQAVFGDLRHFISNTAKSAVNALESGKLADAAVDVTNPEPLPAEHRLWGTPNVLITPHVSGGYHLKATRDRIIRFAVRNIAHLSRGEPFEKFVDMSTGYKINS